MRKATLLVGTLACLGLGTGATQAAPWVSCGTLGSISQLTFQIPGRPLATWEYGIAYITKEPVPVVATAWNRGVRIVNKEPLLVLSDDPAGGMQWGGFLFYQNTLSADDDVCAPEFRHRYWWLDTNNKITTGFSNGCFSDTPVVYCRKR